MMVAPMTVATTMMIVMMALFRPKPARAPRSPKVAQRLLHRARSSALLLAALLRVEGPRSTRTGTAGLCIGHLPCVGLADHAMRID
eukprot:11180356-Lingulodinium_polyedra.AAC.1